MDFLTPETVEEYEDFLYDHQFSTPFHTVEWLKLTKDVFGFEPLCFIERDLHNKICGILPLFKIKNIFHHKLVSLPLRDKGGVLFTNDKAIENILDRALDFTRRNNCDYLQIKSSNPEEGTFLEKRKFVLKDRWPVSHIRLQKTFTDTKKHFQDNRLRWSINKAKKNGLIFEEGRTLDDLHDFYTIFIKNRQRLGIPPYSKKLFSAVYDCFVKKGTAKLFFVSKNGLRLTTIIIFLLNQKAFDVYSASRKSAREYRANDFQLYSVIQWLCDNGYNNLDLGADSPFQESLLRYKRKWGAITDWLSFCYFFHNQPDITYRDSDHPKYKIFRKILINSPKFLFEKIGSKAIKYLA